MTQMDFLDLIPVRDEDLYWQPQEWTPGTKGWMIRVIGVRYLDREQAHKIYVMAELWKSTETPRPDPRSYHKWYTAGEKIGGDHAAWYGGWRKVLRRRPTDAQLLQAAHASEHWRPGIGVIERMSDGMERVLEDATA